MSTATLNTIMNMLNDLSADEKRSLNKSLIARIKLDQTRSSLAASASINIGDIVWFSKPGRGRNAGIHFMKVDGFNRAFTAVVGYECDCNGVRKLPQMKWTAETSLVKHINSL